MWAAVGAGSNGSTPTRAEASSNALDIFQPAVTETWRLQTGSNRRLPARQAGTLTTELWKLNRAGYAIRLHIGRCGMVTAIYSAVCRVRSGASGKRPASSLCGRCSILNPAP